MRAIPQVFFDFVEQHEKLEGAAYRDAGGVWTIGYGHTGPDVHMGLRILPYQAKIWLHQDADVAFKRLSEMLSAGAISRLSDNQYAALGAFVFNVGANASWQIWKTLEAGDLDQVPDQLMRFDNVRLANGKAVEVPGLEQRRAAEAALWNQT